MEKLLAQTKQGLNFYDINKLDPEKVNNLPYSIKVLLEAAVRNCDEFQVKTSDVEKILNWSENKDKKLEIAFKPARVILQDFTGVPAVVDFAAMRDAVQRLGGDPTKVNPQCPVDLVIDHSVQVDVNKSLDAVKQNQTIEFERNRERFEFLKWGADALDNMTIVPPGSGIVHQVNLEYLARVVFNKDNLLYPDSVVGTDSHTTMINGLGILGWGVGGIEAEAVMLGQAISMVLPEVVGYKLTGEIPTYATSTDVVLAITKNLRQLNVVGKFVEFFGEGVAKLSVADRATISNMAPEYGATCGFFAADDMTIAYLRNTGRTEEAIGNIESYLKESGQYRDYVNGVEPEYSQTIELDLNNVQSAISGPKRPHDRIDVADSKTDFHACLTNPVGFKGFGLEDSKLAATATFEHEGQNYSIKHGSIVISAITSCTNTSNPTVMLGAGILAKNAVEAGLSIAPYIKTSLSPGSGVVSYYLESSGVAKYLDILGYQTVGYGCMTCIGNSGPLPDNIVTAINDTDLVAASVLSGNRNFEGRIHPHTRANYLASPMLCIAYAIAGRIDFDFVAEPLGHNAQGKPVFLADIWPTRAVIQEVEHETVIPAIFNDCYEKILQGDENWQSLKQEATVTYKWNDESTYIRHPPFFAEMQRELPAELNSLTARCLLNVGDSVTTDHISPAGSIARTSPAAKYLKAKGIEPRMFNSYGSRRGNDEIMARGTFANIRLVNKLAGRNGPFTKHIPTDTVMPVFDAANRYKTVEKPLIILAGAAYGSGSSRDWAAKGPFLLGIKAVIAVSYERIHRSNLIGMGIIPCQFLDGESADTHGLSGEEEFTISLPDKVAPGCNATVKTDSGKCFEVAVRFDTDVELSYYRNGGILNFMIRSLL